MSARAALLALLLWLGLLAPARADQAAIARGAGLAAIGDCAVCHDGPAGTLAGGRPVATPFGTIWSTNITPDTATGIGGWSLAQFRRAMRHGVAPGGKHLYPAFPYENFARADPADIADLYAWLMAQTPVRATAPPPRLPFPLDRRFLLAGWNLLFLHPGPPHADRDQSAAWNRGRYLVEGIAHCGACHGARNVAGAEKSSIGLGGGMAEGWYAPPLDAASPAPRRWTEAALETYLRTGYDPDHSAAAGPMQAVTRELAHAPAADVHAIATYVAWRMRHAVEAPAPRGRAGPDNAEGARLFAGACAGCHGAGAPMMLEGRPSLALATGLNERSARDLANTILYGIRLPAGAAGPYMPGFAGMLTERQVTAIANWLRADQTGQRPWRDAAHAVDRAMREDGS